MTLRQYERGKSKNSMMGRPLFSRLTAEETYFRCNEKEAATVFQLFKSGKERSSIEYNIGD